MRDEIRFFVNGERVSVRGEEVFSMLGEWLRQKRLLSGTKIVCAEGDCGACTVMLGIPDAHGKIKYEARNSCILPLFNLDGKHVITVEGLKKNDELSPIQLSVAKNGGSQCGYCTPGIVMAITAIFEQHPKPSEEHFRIGLSGNLCRCTGYDGILKSALAVENAQVARLESSWSLPQMSAELSRLAGDSVEIHVEDSFVFMPNNLPEALKFKAENHSVALIAGATDIGVGLNKGHSNSWKFLSLGRIPALDKLEIKDGKLEIGANVSLSKFEEFCKESLPQISKFMTLFAAPQLKNSATLIGNIGNASPIGDTLPFLCVLDAVLEISSVDGARHVNINEYFLAYKKTALEPDEVITKVIMPLPGERTSLMLYKVSKRLHLDISTVSAAFLIKKQGSEVEDFRVAFGGVAPFVKRIPSVEQFMKGKTFSAANMESAAKLAREFFTPLTDVRGSKGFREILVVNLFKKFFTEMEISK